MGAGLQLSLQDKLLTTAYRHAASHRLNSLKTADGSLDGPCLAGHANLLIIYQDALCAMYTVVV